MNKFAACLVELEKTALLERLVRLAATPIKGTPKLVMRVRNPSELKSLQHGVEAAWDKKVSKPLMGVMNKGLRKLPEGRLKRMAEGSAELVAQDPIGVLATQAVPVPGLGAAYITLKKGLEKGIDRFVPLKA